MKPSGSRRLKWLHLESVCKFDFPSAHGVRLNHKEVCLRLHTILHSDTVFPRCYHCMEFSCRPFCIEDRGSKVVVDIGNKFTWIVTPSFGVRRHFSMFGIPKMPSNDSNVDRSVALSSILHSHFCQVLGLSLADLKPLL
jgi:hypothetical protein